METAADTEAETAADTEADTEAETAADTETETAAGTAGDTETETAAGTDRTTVLRAAVVGVPSDDLRSALAKTADPERGAPRAAGNALHALRRHRHPATVIDRPQYRAALPYLAGAIAEDCLARTVELLGDDSESPTREQLVPVLDEVCDSFPVTTVAVMLASVAHDDLPSSDLCFEIVRSDPRFGLTELGPEDEPEPSSTGPGTVRPEGTSPEQRAARRTRKERAASERRRQVEVARRADEQMRQARKDVRSRDRRAARPLDTDLE